MLPKPANSRAPDLAAIESADDVCMLAGIAVSSADAYSAISAAYRNKQRQTGGAAFLAPLNFHAEGM
jgi:hypothetical protein